MLNATIMNVETLKKTIKNIDDDMLKESLAGSLVRNIIKMWYHSRPSSSNSSSSSSHHVETPMPTPSLTTPTLLSTPQPFQLLPIPLRKLKINQIKMCRNVVNPDYHEECTQKIKEGLITIDKLQLLYLVYCGVMVVYGIYQTIKYISQQRRGTIMLPDSLVAWLPRCLERPTHMLYRVTFSIIWLFRCLVISLIFLGNVVSFYGQWLR
eukprot:TRINITY_DN7060_c0_g1_i1.p1 TRINITY_DN7060_c0_g1~~TRINITY_DN7060_c0_g1_i1.p1  ORF type:complete len:209 (-),score=20.90 TRINITY_DN7060_c0_g1_i1:120-746(-)